MRIGDLSKRTGVSIRMLRYYEEEGLLTPPRLASGYREYSEAEEQVARRIRLLSEAGLKLDTIRRRLPCVRSDRPDFVPCPEVLATLRREVTGLDERIDRLQSSRTILAGYLERLG
ncbi:MerR family transcriptional regulator [Xanthobacter flavus]|uniref:MerR family transcriptional regulator n=1 Tax=Xanthobacter flavus TaxID=281 RepID=UPI003727403C